MAENKKSFLLYCDLIHTVEKMPDDKAGLLIKHILKYVNDLQPETEDLIVQLTFEPIKQQLKRDLLKWNQFIEKQSNNGKLGGRPKNQTNPNNPSLILDNPNEPKKAVTVTVTDNVIVNDKVIKKENNIEARKLKFAHSLVPFIDKYGKEMIRKFHDYWTEPNISNTKMAFELKRTWSLPHRLSTWADRNIDNKKQIIQPVSNKPKFTTHEDLNKPLA